MAFPSTLTAAVQICIVGPPVTASQGTEVVGTFTWVQAPTIL